MTFTVSAKDEKKIRAFMKKQEKITQGRYGAIGGGYTYRFTPTSIGVAFEVKNNITGAVLDLTDYNVW